MKILGIDYGLKKIGLAVAESGSIAEPLSVLKVNSQEEAIQKVEQVQEVEKVDIIVLGISEGKMGKKSLDFGKSLMKRLGVKVIYQDETLTTKEAQRLSIEAGQKRKRRRQMEDAYSATLILNEYLEK